MAKRTQPSEAPAFALPPIEPAPAAPVLNPGDKCPDCKGGGILDNVEHLPWKRMDPVHNIRIGKGECLPEPCLKCAGTGKIQPTS